MTICNSVIRPSLLLFAMRVSAGPALLVADRSESKRLKLGQFNPNEESVELFAGIEAKQISVNVIAKDSTQANVLAATLPAGH